MRHNTENLENNEGKAEINTLDEKTGSSENQRDFEFTGLYPCGAVSEQLYSAKKPIIVAFDVDGHLMDTETYAYPAWYQGLLAYFADDKTASENVQKLISPDIQGGKDYFASHFMGHSHREINQEINQNITPYNPMTLDTFRTDLLADIDDRIADTVTPASVFPGIVEMLQDLKKLQEAGEIKLFFVSGSAVKRLRTSFRNSGLDAFIDDFDTQVYSGENYTNKNEVFRQLAEGDAGRVIYSGDGYGDARSCKNVVGSENAFFIGKSQGSHCPANHYENLKACGADVMTRNGYELHEAIIDRISFLLSKNAKENAFNRPISCAMPDNGDDKRMLTDKDIAVIKLSQRQNG